MTEAEARALLAGSGIEALDPWIATQPWQAVPKGWRVAPALDGWIFRVEVAPAGQVRIVAFPPSGTPVVWIVPAVAK